MQWHDRREDRRARAHDDAQLTRLEELRQACPEALVIILISSLDARQQAALSAGADAFISKDEAPDRVAERLRNAAASVVGE